MGPRRKRSAESNGDETISDFCVCVSSIHVGDNVYVDGHTYRWGEPGPTEAPSHFVPLLSTTRERDEARTRTMEPAYGPR
jgi:hypothetical protein